MCRNFRYFLSFNTREWALISAVTDGTGAFDTGDIPAVTDGPDVFTVLSTFLHTSTGISTKYFQVSHHTSCNRKLWLRTYRSHQYLKRIVISIRKQESRNLPDCQLFNMYPTCRIAVRACPVTADSTSIFTSWNILTRSQHLLCSYTDLIPALQPACHYRQSDRLLRYHHDTTGRRWP